MRQQQNPMRGRPLRKQQPSQHHGNGKDKVRTRENDIPLRACNLRVVTGHRAGLGLCLAVNGKKCRSGSQARSSPSVCKAFTGESIGKAPKSAKHLLRYLSEGSPLWPWISSE